MVEPALSAPPEPRKQPVHPPATASSEKIVNESRRLKANAAAKNQSHSGVVGKRLVVRAR